MPFSITFQPKQANKKPRMCPSFSSLFSAMVGAKCSHHPVCVRFFAQYYLCVQGGGGKGGQTKVPKMTKSDLIVTNIAISVNKSALWVNQKSALSVNKSGLTVNKSALSVKKVPSQSKTAPFQ